MCQLACMCELYGTHQHNKLSVTPSKLLTNTNDDGLKKKKTYQSFTQGIELGNATYNMRMLSNKINTYQHNKTFPPPSAARRPLNLTKPNKPNRPFEIIVMVLI